MKTKFVHIASILTIASAPAVFAQEAEMAEKVVMRQGIFWPKHETEGKNYFRGAWWDVTDDKPWQLPSNDSMRDLLEPMINNPVFLSSFGVDNLDDLASVALGYDTWDEYVVSTDNNWNLINSDFGLINSEVSAPVTDQEKANFLADLSTMSTENIYQLFGNGPRDMFDFQGPEGYTGTDGELARMAWEIYSQRPDAVAGVKSMILPFALDGNPNYDVSGYDLTGVVLSFVTSPLSQHNITPQQIASLNGLHNVNLSGIDLSNVSLSGLQQFSGVDLSGTGINGEWLNTNIPSIATRVVVGAADLANFNTVGKTLRGWDLSSTTGLTAAMINAVSGTGISGIIYPDGFNFSGVVTSGKYLGGSDLSGTTGLSISQLNSALDISYIRLPNGISLAELVTTNKSLAGIDFTQTLGLTGNQLTLAAGDLSGVNLHGKNLSGFNPTGKSLYGANLTQTTGVTAQQLNGATNLLSANLSGWDMTNFNPTGKSLQGVNFAGATNLTPEMLAQATALSGVILTNTGITEGQLAAALEAVGKSIDNQWFRAIQF